MYDKQRGLYIAHSSEGALSITGKMANRHGLIAGATGTGKTVTLQVMAETFCQAGVPCFMADMKGDLSGISQVGKMSSFIEKRLPEFGLEAPQFQSCPVRFYDVFGEQGHPMRATISQMGPLLLSRLLGLNDTQDGVLNIVFRIADERGWLLDDLKDLRAVLGFVAKHAKEYASKYGNVASASVGAIQRALLQLENQGADKFFGLPSFDIQDLLATMPDSASPTGRKGVMSVLAADKLMMQPKLERPGRRQADDAAQALLHLPALAPQRALQHAARGGRPAAAQTGVLLRRGPHAVCRHQQGTVGQD